MTKTKKVILIAVAAVVVATLVSGFVFWLCSCSGGKGSYGFGEEGFYYYDGSDDQRYMLSLQSGAYMISTDAEGSYSGSYSYDDDAGEISFSGDGEDFKASVGENSLSLVMTDSGYAFKAFRYFTVTYYGDDGEILDTRSILNGKSAEPLTYEREGCYFIGWYEDAECTREFAFDTSIAGDTALYAWLIEKKQGVTEYTVTLDYGDGEEGETLTTRNGAVWTALPSEKDGDAILGWWVSATNKKEELTYKYVSGGVLTADTTFFAVYGKDSPLGASVTSSGITWENTGLSVNTSVTVSDASGAVVASGSALTSAKFCLPDGFSSLGTGVYTVTVSGGKTETLTYVVNGLPRVSVSSVDVVVNGSGEVLSFAPVDGAEGYAVLITNGEREFAEDLGTRTYYNFSNWEMTKTGIRFTIYAYADGYVVSASDEYVYLLALAPVALDITDDEIFWTASEGAIYYEVEIYSGDTLVDRVVTADTSLSLKYYDAGTYDIFVRPVAEGYFSESSPYMGYSKVTLAAPVITDVSDYSVSWSAVTGATSYKVFVNGALYMQTGSTTYFISGVTPGLGTYEITVKASGDGVDDSPYSDAATATENGFSHAVSYEMNTVRWNYDIAAAYYVVSVNGETQRAEKGNGLEITLTRSGYNDITVTAYGPDDSDMGSAFVSVYAYTVILDGNGAAAETPYLYVAQGDVLHLGGVERENAEFVGWYTLPDYGSGLSDSYGGRGTRVEDGSIFTGSRDVYLYAYWVFSTVEVSLYAGDALMGTADIRYTDASFSLDAPAASSEEEDFIGWYTEKNGKGTRYTDELGEATGNGYAGETAFYAYFSETRSYKSATYNGKDVYSVSAGSGIDLLSVMTIPDGYRGYDIIIGSGAFVNCPGLTIVNIPDTVLYVAVSGDGYTLGTGSAFAGCPSLTDVNVYVTGNSGIPYYFSCDGVLFHEVAEGSEDVEILYYPYGRGLCSYTLPSVVYNGYEADVTGICHDVTTIPYRVFNDRKIKEIVIPATVTTIGSQAFYSNAYLKDVIFEEGGTAALTIAEDAFSYCSAITDITLPARIAEFSASVFADCESLTNINMEKGGRYSSDGGVLLDAAGTTLLYVPIGRSGEIVISELTKGSITAIGENAFVSNEKITSVSISASVTEIYESAFEGCTGLEELTFAGTADSRDLYIHTRAFYGCVRLTSVTLPPNLTIMEKDAFGGCTNILTVIFDARANTSAKDLDFATGSFGASNNVTTIVLGANVPAIEFDGIFGGGRLSEIIIEEGNESFASDDRGVVYSSDMSTLIYCPTAISGDYVVDGSATKIASGVFADRVGLTSVTIGKNVNTIGDGTFSGCVNLEKIIVDSENSNFASDEVGILYGKDDLGYLVEIICCPLKSSATSVSSSTVTKIDAEAFMNTSVETVEITSSFLEIGEYAFYGCASLKTVAVPDSVDSIPDYAFYDCAALSSVNIPTGVTKIGSYAFYKCASLKGDLTDSQNGSVTAVTLPEGLKTVGDYAFYGISDLAVTIPSSVEKIGDYAFCQCWASSYAQRPITFAAGGDGEADSLVIGDHAFFQATFATSLVLPDRTLSVGSSAFECLGNSVSASGGGSQSAKTEFSLGTEGSRLEYIGYRAFYNSDNIESVFIPDSVREIGESAFDNCSGVTDVTFGENSALTKICDYALRQTSITGIELPASLETIGAYAFYNTKLESVDIPAGVTSLGDSAFRGNKNLVSVSFQNREDGEESLMTVIGCYSFASCTSLSSVDLPANLTTFEEYIYNNHGVFEGCTALEEITIPASVTTISTYTFKGCTSLSSVVFETYSDGKCSLSEIGKGAFEGCTALTTFEFPESRHEISLGTGIFSGSGLASVTLSSEISGLGSIFTGANITSINVAEGSVYTVDEENSILYNTGNREIAYVYGTIQTETLEIPEGIENIGGSAFDGQTGIVTVKIDSAVINIGAYAFNGCTSLRTVEIGGGSAVSVTLGEYAFNGCASLLDINLSDDIKEIPAYCFYGCSELGISIPESVTAIGDRAFYETAISGDVSLPNIATVGEYAFCGVTAISSVTLGKSLTKLGAHAVDGCTALTSVEFSDALSFYEIESGVFTNCTALTHVGLPQNVTKIGINAFWGCTSLKEITLPASLNQIDKQAFGNCTSLETCVLPNKLATLGESAFYMCSSLKSVVFPDSLTSVGSECFKSAGLTEVVMNDNLKTISSSAFSGCKGLTAVTVGKGVTSVGTSAFENCTGLAYAYTGDSLTSLPSSMFKGCTALEKVEFGPVLMEIGESAFSGCTKLSSVDFGNVLVSIGASAFSNCTSLGSLIMPSSVSYVGDGAFAGCGCDISVKNSEAYVNANWSSSWKENHTGSVSYDA